jgi:histidinol-phosphate aminotransferase
MSADWAKLVREPLRDLGPYVPGANASEVEAKYGIAHLERLNWNEGLFGPLPGVLEATAERLQESWKYPEQAYEELRDSVAGWLGVPREQVLPGHGIQGLVLTVVSSFVSPGDRVVVPWPTYGLYAPVCRTAGAGGQPGVARAHGNFNAPVVERVDASDLDFDLARIATVARETDARLVWICDPNNPTGAQLDPADWAPFLDALPERCVVVVDEAYVDYVRPGDRTRRLDDVAAGRPVIVLRTFSKVFALAGLRLGYAIAHPELVPYLHSVQEPFNVNSAALAAGCAALADPTRVEARREETLTCRRLFVERLEDAGLRSLPSAANFVLVSLDGGDDVAIADRVARRGIMLRACSEFQLPGYIRVTVAPQPLMERAARELIGAWRAEEAIV